MANVPFPLTAEDIEGIKTQVYELIRQVFEEKIGGADLGDVFSLAGDVLTLELADSPGLQKTGNKLAVQPTSTGGLQVASAGLSVKLDGSSLTVGASGLKVGQSTHIDDPGADLGQLVTAVTAILDLLTERGLMA